MKIHSGRAVVLGVETQGDLTRRILGVAHGQKAGDDRISFESVDELWRMLAPNGMEIVRVMTGAGPLSIRRVARDLKHLAPSFKGKT
jgi:predicted transcriptional regulator